MRFNQSPITTVVILSHNPAQAGTKSARLHFFHFYNLEQSCDLSVLIHVDIVRRRFFGSPGIVMIAPVSATTKPAPRTHRRRAPSDQILRTSSFFWSSDKEYWVFAMQTGRSPNPISVIFAIAFFAAGE